VRIFLPSYAEPTLPLDFALPLNDPVLIVALVLMIILIAPLVITRLRIPGMVGLIAAGIIVGPNGLDLLARDQTIILLGTFGLLYLMFIAGLDIDMNRFLRYRSHSIVFGALTFLIPQVLGTVMAVYVLEFDLTTAILLASMFASHTLIAYPIASRLGISRSPAVTTAVGGTIITDTLALLVLAVIVSSTRGALTAGFWLQLAAGLLVFGFLVLVLMPLVARWFFRNAERGGAAEFMFVLVCVFVGAALALAAGIEAIIGAFMVGFALNRFIPERSPLMNRLQFFGNAFFIPFFLISVGMLVDLRVFVGEWTAWIVAGMMTVTVHGTKWCAALVSARLLGYGRDEAYVIFGLSVAQAAATLAAVLIGYQIGLFGDSVLNGAIMMILVSCIVAPWVTERHGRRLALRMENVPLPQEDMSQRLLVPLANPDTAPALLDFALMLQPPRTSDPLFVLAVVAPEGDENDAVRRGELLLADAITHAASTGRSVTTMVRLDLNPASGIDRAIRERRMSHVVMGWRGNIDVEARIFGTVFDQVLETTRVAVIVTRLTRPLGTTERVRLIVPEWIEREPGIDSILNPVLMLASQASAALEVLGKPESIAAVQRFAASISTDITVRGAVLDPSSDVAGFVHDTALEDDLVFLVGARHGSVSWHPGLDRLPRATAERLPGSNLVVGFPAIP
jgi:Kef-type K+ transport system membrane component KefB